MRVPEYVLRIDDRYEEYYKTLLHCGKRIYSLLANLKDEDFMRRARFYNVTEASAMSMRCVISTPLILLEMFKQRPPALNRDDIEKVFRYILDNKGDV